MSEKEIIKNIKEMIQWSDHSTYKMALQGLLDLYQTKTEQLETALNSLKKEKEKNKELYEDNQKQLEERCRLTFEFDNYTSKDKIRKIIYPTPTNLISYEIQTSDMYKKLEQLLEEE